MRFRRWSQIFSLAIFLYLLAEAVSNPFLVPVDLFMRMDPALITVTAVSGRTFTFAFIPAVIVLLLVPVAGRLFCGYICPMGTTLDGGDEFIGSPKKQVQSGRLRKIKYVILAFMLGAAAFGVSFVFVASPLSLITRLYGVVVYPVLIFLANGILGLVRPIADHLDLFTLAYAQIKTPRFATQFFILAFFAALFAAAKFSPRFWCRYICPAGAMMALFSRRPLVGRRVSEDCTDCGKCVRQCPMAAIMEDDPEITRFEECIVCRTCESVCPVNAITFAYEKQNPAYESDGISITRRNFINSGLVGAGTAVVSLTGLNSLYGKPGEGQVAPPGLLRPPGALPEMDFLSQCVRCGECVAACPTNCLQPIWLSAGFMGLFSPSFVPRRGYCDPKCNRCGQVCPTGAIRSLPKNDRIWAKMGTSVITPEKCLAWEHKKGCMVCDEVCGFDAVVFNKVPGNPVPVPEIIEDKCSGCGFCEHFCPVQNQSAIVVKPMNALRLVKGSFEKEGKARGFSISLKPKEGYSGLPFEGAAVPGGYAPGFDEE